jgi:hypothetical protein
MIWGCGHKRRDNGAALTKRFQRLLATAYTHQYPAELAMTCCEVRLPPRISGVGFGQALSDGVVCVWFYDRWNVMSALRSLTHDEKVFLTPYICQGAE